MSADGQSGAQPRMLLFQLSELNPLMRSDPHAILDEQRSRAPVEHDDLFPAVCITAYGPARDMLNDQSISRNFEHASPDNFVIAGVKRLNHAVEEEFGRHDSMLILEDPDHARVRGIVAKLFLARASQSRPLIERVVEDALAKLEGRESFDVVSEYACHIPINVLGPVLGCPTDQLEQLRLWTEAGQTAFDPTAGEQAAERAIAGRRGILSTFRALMEARRAEPRDDLVSDLLRAQAEGAEISDGEILHNLFALLVAGHLTTADLIGNGVMLLLTHPESREAIRKEPALIAPAIDEALRYEPPVTTTARFPSEDGAIGGCPYRAGDALSVSLLAANRDPDVFPDPHKFDVRRRPNPHLAFGAGSHMCVGAPLARVEGQIAIGRLLDRFPSLRLARPEAAPEWRAIAGIRGLTRLDVLS
ncbi:MAG: cytochrome P450 [Hyphomonadaceae bacterium]